MDEKVKLNLGDIQKTLFLPLWGRAIETKKKRPSLVDETAVNIIEKVDVDFSKASENLDDLTKIAWIKRSLISDRIIRQFLKGFLMGQLSISAADWIQLLIV